MKKDAKKIQNQVPTKIFIKTAPYLHQKSSNWVREI